jgi:flagellar biosynthesis/type III secretory pathway chaperone
VSEARPAAELATADLVAELAGITRNLVDIVQAETLALSEPQVPDLEAFVRAKTTLSVRYDGLMRELAIRPPEAIRDAPALPALRETMTVLGKATEANRRTIELHLRATRRVLSVVARAARQATEPTFTYGRERLGYGSRNPASAAVAFNRVM